MNKVKCKKCFESFDMPIDLGSWQCPNCNNLDYVTISCLKQYIKAKREYYNRYSECFI